VAYDYACSHQEHGAYTDYYFNAVGDNLRREKQGLAPNAIIPEKEWVAGYQLRLEYTEYYHDALADIAKTNNQPGLAFKTIPPFDEWKTNEYIQMMEDRARLQQRGHKPAPTR